MNKEGFFEIPWQTTCNRNISYNCLDAAIAWSENRRSGNRVVEIENFVSSHAGKHSIHDKPVSNSSSTPASLTSVNNGVHHLSLRRKRKRNSWKYSFNSFKWFLNWSENFGKTSFNFWFLFCFWVVLRGFEKILNTSISAQTWKMLQGAHFDFEHILLNNIFHIHRYALA